MSPASACSKPRPALARLRYQVGSESARARLRSAARVAPESLRQRGRRRRSRRASSPSNTRRVRASSTRCSSRRACSTRSGHGAEALDDFKRVLAYYETFRPSQHRCRDHARIDGDRRARHRARRRWHAPHDRRDSRSTRRSMAKEDSVEVASPAQHARRGRRRVRRATTKPRSRPTSAHSKMTAKVIGEDNDLYAMVARPNSPARSSIWAATRKPSRISTARSRSRRQARRRFTCSR